ncbi:UNVERIFIED_CONTAM: hypothetical protein Slati_2911000 [Sesamum latifolium]|uniref:Uncharacterized protein n=1 Tax=Sesamum latifolium TaxID=2727402 RepID=A0AAW2VD79_9LAMI
MDDPFCRCILTGLFFLLVLTTFEPIPAPGSAHPFLSCILAPALLLFPTFQYELFEVYLWFSLAIAGASLSLSSSSPWPWSYSKVYICDTWASRTPSRYYLDLSQIGILYLFDDLIHGLGLDF